MAPQKVRDLRKSKIVLDFKQMRIPEKGMVSVDGPGPFFENCRDKSVVAAYHDHLSRHQQQLVLLIDEADS